VSRQQIAEMGVHEDLHVRRNLVACHRPQDEMPVVRHQAKGDQSNDGALGGVQHSTKEPDVVFVAAKDFGLSVATIHDVLRHIVWKDTCWAAHGETLFQRSCQSVGRLPRMVAGTFGASHHAAYVSGCGASGVGQMTRVNWPRCRSSRPFPPRPVTSYFPVLMVCSAPRLVSTVNRSRSPVEAMKPSTRSSFADSLMRITPRPGPERKFTSSAFASSPRASRVAAISTSPPESLATPTTSAPSATLANRPR